jgi:hypothetical protein
VTTPHLAGHPAASQQAIVDAALLMLRQMSLSPGDLVTAPQEPPPGQVGSPARSAASLRLPARCQIPASLTRRALLVASDVSASGISVA